MPEAEASYMPNGRTFATMCNRRTRSESSGRNRKRCCGLRSPIATRGPRVWPLVRIGWAPSRSASSPAPPTSTAPKSPPCATSSPRGSGRLPRSARPVGLEPRILRRGRRGQERFVLARSGPLLQRAEPRARLTWSSAHGFSGLTVYRISTKYEQLGHDCQKPRYLRMPARQADAPAVARGARSR
jgi:hypothetical protein